jgi:hypothetical protein
MIECTWCKFGALIWVCMSISIFWDIPQCNPLKINQRFGGIQGGLISLCLY